MVREISRSGLSSSVTWGDVPSKICGDFASVGQGLYAFVFVNDEDGHVYDNNKKPKVVVHGRGASLKPGKFEQGFRVRLHNYNAHLHWQDRNGDRRWALQECFAGGYILDLSATAEHVPTAARIFERYWNEAVNAFLKSREVLADSVDQLGRAEWRYVERRRWTDATQLEFRTYLDDVAARIMRMAAVGGFPQGVGATP
jgi:hypothetical protein